MKGIRLSTAERGSGLIMDFQHSSGHEICLTKTITSNYSLQAAMQDNMHQFWVIPAHLELLYVILFNDGIKDDKRFLSNALTLAVP